jgi:hypothetical protein
MEGEVDPRSQILKRYSAFDEVISQRSCRKLTFTVTDQSHDEMIDHPSWPRKLLRAVVARLLGRKP